VVNSVLDGVLACMDAASRSRPGLIRFGFFEVDLRSGELRRQGVKVKLQEQPFHLLRMLLEHCGDIVTREELQKSIWPSDTFVDFEQGLNNAAKRLREALSDSADAPHFIETIPRRGYRFIASINTSPRQAESLVVLPLENLPRDSEQEYFADGLTEALINSLAKIAALQVISRTTSMRYKKTDKTLPQIASELNVDAIIEGTVLRSGQRVRISVQLIDAHRDTHLWAQTYDRDLRDILALHAEVAQAVAREVQVKLTPHDYAHFAHTHPVDPEAYEAYLKGRYYWNRRPAELGKAIRCLEQATTRDPGYAAALTGLADCLNSLTVYGLAPPNEGSVKAKHLAQRALEIGHSLAEAHTALGLATAYDYDFSTAEREFERAIELNPRYAHAHAMFSFLLAWTGRYEEAYTEVQRALRLDPLSSITNSMVGWVYFHGRRYDQAIEQLQKTLELDPRSGISWAFLGWVQSCKSLHESAITSLRKSCEIYPGSGPIAWLGQVYAAAGYRGEALKILEQLQELSKQQYVSPYGVGRIYVALGQTEEAFLWLETAYEQRANWMVYLKVDPVFDDLRSDPRFQDLMRRMNFPE
jgi:TolB-like protein/Tfp pilus assembly protein PilF